MHVKKGKTCRNFRQQIKMGFVVTSSGERRWKGNEPGVVCFVPGFAHINHQKAGVYCLAFELRLLPLDSILQDHLMRF